MASSRDRERKLARAKVERQMARRAEKAVAQRRTRARVASVLAVLLIAAGVTWAAGGFGKLFGSKAKNTADNTTTCVWAPDATGSKALKDVGTPPASGIATTGTDTMTITTNQGAIAVTLDRSSAPCAAASFEYLASKNFFDKTACTNLSATTVYLLQCGDPGTPASTTGGPNYTFADENPPYGFTVPSNAPSPSPGTDTPSEVIYPAGTVAMAHPNGQGDANGSQFFIIYKDSALAPDYSVIGQVASGLDVVTKVAAGGTNAADSTTGITSPKIPVTISTLTVTTDAATPSPAPGASAIPSGSAASPPAPTGSAS